MCKIFAWIGIGERKNIFKIRDKYLEFINSGYRCILQPLGHSGVFAQAQRVPQQVVTQGPEGVDHVAVIAGAVSQPVAGQAACVRDDRCLGRGAQTALPVGDVSRVASDTLNVPGDNTMHF